MYPEGTNNQGTQTGGATQPPRRNGGEGPAHRQVQQAHDQYFQDLMQAWNETVQDFQAMQNDFQRSVEKAMQNQDVAAMQGANFDLQRQFQDTSMSPDVRNKYIGAFRNYKESILKAIANADVDDLSYTDLAMLSQSLAIVAPYAFMLTMTTCDPSQLARSADQRNIAQPSNNR